MAIDSIDDMETLLAGIPLDRVTVSMTINAPASILLAFLLAIARRRGIPFDKLGGTIQNDVLKEYAARGTYIYPPDPRCARSPTSCNTARARCRNGTRSRSPVITFAKPARPPSKRSRSPSRTAKRTCRPPATPASMWTRSRREYRSFGTRTTISSRRSPSSGRRAIFGRTSRATSSAVRIRGRICCASTRRPAVRR